MHTESIVFRKATPSDVGFMAEILIDAALASGERITMRDLPSCPDAYQYIEGFPTGADVGVIAETPQGCLVGAAWLRLLPTAAHAVTKHLPELTMGVRIAYRRMGLGTRLMEELYKTAMGVGINEIALGVHKGNSAAISLYTKQHWLEEGTFGEYIMMRRKITG